MTALAGLANATLPTAAVQAAPPVQAAPGADELALQDVSIVREPGRTGVQILTSRPILPQISKPPDSDSIVIDTRAVFAPGQRVITAPSAGIRSVRVAQYRRQPPGTRIEIQLSEPLQYSVVASGNKTVLWVLLPPAAAGAARGSASLPPQPTSEEAASPTQAMEQAMLTGARSVNAPGTISAASETAIVNLPRGGEVHVCPNTALSLTTSQNGRNLMLGMSTGALETHYTLPLGAADIILTPDLRILLPGPGTFEFAISADHRGNTCVRALEGDTASLVISELMGDDNAQVGPSEQMVFRSGRVKNVSATATPGCGCPRPVVPVLQAGSSQPAPRPTPAVSLGSNSPRAAANASAPQPDDRAEAKPPASATRPVNPKRPHVEVEAPFVFRASEAAPPPPAVAHLRLASDTPAALRDTRIQPPALVSFYRVDAKHSSQRQSRGVFGKLRAFFGGMFR
jgi:hypothetical protein